MQDKTYGDPFELQMQDFRIRSSVYAPVGYMNAADDFDLLAMFTLHPSHNLPKWRVTRHCKFSKAYFVLALYSFAVSDETSLEKLACYTDETTRRFQINIGFLDSERPVDPYAKNGWSQRIVVVRSEMPIPNDFDVFLHHDNIDTPELKGSPVSNKAQIYPLQTADYILRSASPVRKLSQGVCPPSLSKLKR